MSNMGINGLTGQSGDDGDDGGCYSEDEREGYSTKRDTDLSGLHNHLGGMDLALGFDDFMKSRQDNEGDMFATVSAWSELKKLLYS
jgi:hypothetical protein